MAWARLYHKYSLQQWARVIWSDEAYIYLGDDRGRVFVTRRPDEEYLDECLVPTFKQSPVRVMVWACIMKGRKGPFVTCRWHVRLDVSGIGSVAKLLEVSVLSTDPEPLLT
jgi:hypothetical protein